MALSPQQSPQALEHVVNTVLATISPHQGADKLMVAMTETGVHGIEDLMTVDKAAIDTLQCTDDNGNCEELHLSCRKIIVVFCEFVAWRHNQGDPVGTDCTSITREEFSDFRNGQSQPPHCLSKEWLSMCSQSHSSTRIHTCTCHHKDFLHTCANVQEGHQTRSQPLSHFEA